MAFVDYEYLTAVREFLLTYPHELPYKRLEIDHELIVELQGSDSGNAGAALISGGISTINILTNVRGKKIYNNRINFSLAMWREANDDEFRRDFTNSMNRLINWVKEENAKRGTPQENSALPHFSTTNSETISADGGVKIAMIGATRAEYHIQMHVDFQRFY